MSDYDEDENYEDEDDIALPNPLKDSALVFIIAILLLAPIAGVVVFFKYPVWKAEKLFEKAAIEIKQSNFEYAFDLLGEAYEHDPDNSDVASTYLQLLLERDPAKALPLLKEQVKPDSPQKEHRMLAECLLALGKLDEAISQVEILLKENDTSAENLYLAGRVTLAAKEYKIATAWFTQAIKLSPKNLDLKFYRAQALTHDARNVVNRITAKADLMALADNPDFFKSEEALFFIAQSTKLPLFAKDLEWVYENLKIVDGLKEKVAQLDLEKRRLIVQRMASFHPEVAADLSQAVIAHPEANYDDQLTFIKITHHANQPALGLPVLQSLLRDAPADLELTLLLSKNKFLEGDHIEGRAILEAVLKENPQSAECQKTILYALSSPHVKPIISERKKLLQLVIDHPLSSSREKLAALQEKLDLEPLQRKQIIQKAVNLIGEEDLPELTHWLNLQGEFDHSLKLIKEAADNEDPRLLQTHANALLQLKALDSLKQLIDQRKQSLTPLQYAFYYCQYYYQSENLAEARRYWDQTRMLAEQKDAATPLLVLARMTELFSEPTPLISAYQQAQIAGAALSKEDWLIYFTLLVKTNRLDEAIKAASDAIEVFPNQAVFINNHAYLSLLLNQNVSEITQNMRALVKEYPNQKEFLLTLALAYHRQGEAGKALDLIEKIDTQDNDDSSAMAVYAAVLAANGRSNIAQTLARNIKREQLIEPEWKLVNNLIEKKE